MNTRNARRLISVASSALLFSAAHVSADVINVPGDWPQIQMAIGFASDGDTILVQPGDYLEHIDLLGKAITLRSTDPFDPVIVWITRITGPVALPTVTCDSGEGGGTVIKGLTITHLNPAGSDHGMYNHQTSPKVEHCIFYGNHTADSGGGMFNDHASPTVRYCTFEANSAVSVGGGVFSNEGSPSITNCDFLNNTAANGGGMYSVGDQPWVQLCDFEDNVATENGGGLMINLGDDRIVRECDFRRNLADKGGGFYNLSSDTIINDCLFAQNVADNGGAIYNASGSPRILHSGFGQNDANSRGGGIYNDECSVEIDDCWFSLNRATSGDTIHSRNSDQQISDCYFVGSEGSGRYDQLGGVNWSLWARAATGACCLDSGCVVASEANCIAAGGTYLGDGTDCDDDPCGAPCIGDLNGDGQRDQADLGLLLSFYGQSCP